MNSDQSEQALRGLFRGLREGDEKKAPAFESLLDPSIARRPAARRWKPRLSLTGAFACAALVFVAFFLLGRSSSDDHFSGTLRLAQTIASWQAPTDILLEPPDQTLFRETPEIGDIFGDSSINLQ